MTDVLFYHLTSQPLERALPLLLEKSLERGWRVAVQSVSDSECEKLDGHLWTYAPESFLPHASAHDDHGVASLDIPIWITTDTANPSNAQVRFMVHGAIPGDLQTYDRVIYMFDGSDQDAVAGARERWRAENAAGHALTYWQQSETGGWSKKADNNKAG